LKKYFLSSFDQPQYNCVLFEIAKLCCYSLKGVQNVGICVVTSYNGMTIYRNKNRWARLKNISFAALKSLRTTFTTTKKDLAGITSLTSSKMSSTTFWV